MKLGRIISLNTIVALVIFALSMISGFGVQAFSIAPKTIEFRAKPGSVNQFKININNDETSSVCWKLEIQPIAGMTNTGSPIFNNEPSEIASWIKLDRPTVCALAGQTVTSTLIITIPSVVTSSSYYAAVFFTPAITTSTQNGSAVINRVGTLIAIRLDGVPALEQGKISAFSFDGQQKKFIVDFTNDGDVYLRPYGDIIIKNKKGAVLETLPFNEQGMIVLPNSNRLFETIWTKRMYEPVVATLEIFYGTGPKAATASTEINFAGVSDGMESKIITVIALVLLAILIKVAAKKIRSTHYV